MEFEVFYLSELLAEGLIDEALFKAVLEDIQNEKKYEKEEELEL